MTTIDLNQDVSVDWADQAGFMNKRFSSLRDALRFVAEQLDAKRQKSAKIKTRHTSYTFDEIAVMHRVVTAATPRLTLFQCDNCKLPGVEAALHGSHEISADAAEFAQRCVEASAASGPLHCSHFRKAAGDAGVDLSKAVQQA